MVFYCEFSAFKVVLLCIAYFYLLCFLSENKPNIHNNIIDISSFQNGLNNFFSSAGFYLKSEALEGSRKGKNMFFNFRALFLKMYIFAVVTFIIA